MNKPGQSHTHTASLQTTCVTSLSCMCVCYSISQRGGIGESTAALYGCENNLTHWQRGSSDFFFCCCCIIVWRIREVLLLELRYLTLISQFILLMLQSHTFCSGVKHIFLALNARHLTCVQIFFYACEIYSQPPTHTALAPQVLNSCAFVCQVQYSTRKGGGCLFFVLTAPCWGLKP